MPTKHQITLSRRQVLGAGLTAIAAPAVTRLGPLAQGAAAATTLTPEQEEGPFYVSLEQIRRDIAEGQAGVPLHLAIRLLDSSSSSPISGAALDIWHCNASGIYSDESSESTSGKTWLRGVQLTNSAGIARFETIYPGHYEGRTTHVHVKVHIGGSSGSASYSGGHVCHTGQLFFSDAISSKVYATHAYRHDTAARVANGRDAVYSGQGGSHCMLALRRRSGSLTGSGYEASVTLAVDPAATPAAVSRG